MPGVALNGVDFWIDVVGHAGGTPVVLLHGLGSSSVDWTFQIPAFAGQHRVLAVDLPGHGQARPSRRHPGIVDVAHALDAALAAVGEREVHVVGLSLGGCVGLALAAAHPARVRSLTVVNAFARLAPAGLPGVARAVHRVALACAAPMPTLAAHVARTLFPKPGQRELFDMAVRSLSSTPRRTYLASMAALARFDGRARLADVRCPTLVVVGDRDATVPRPAAERLCETIPRARLLIVCDSGHATPYDQPQVFNREVLAFIAGAS